MRTGVRVSGLGVSGTHLIVFEALNEGTRGEEVFRCD